MSVCVCGQRRPTRTCGGSCRLRRDLWYSRVLRGSGLTVRPRPHHARHGAPITRASPWLREDNWLDRGSCAPVGVRGTSRQTLVNNVDINIPCQPLCQGEFQGTFTKGLFLVWILPTRLQPTLRIYISQSDIQSFSFWTVCFKIEPVEVVDTFVENNESLWFYDFRWFPTKAVVSSVYCTGFPWRCDYPMSSTKEKTRKRIGPKMEPRVTHNSF